MITDISSLELVHSFGHELSLSKRVKRVVAFLENLIEVNFEEDAIPELLLESNCLSKKKRLRKYWKEIVEENEDAVPSSIQSKAALVFILLYLVDRQPTYIMSSPAPTVHLKYGAEASFIVYHSDNLIFMDNDGKYAIVPIPSLLPRDLQSAQFLLRSLAENPQHVIQMITDEIDSHLHPIQGSS
jgi:hypothetical protein